MKKKLIVGISCGVGALIIGLGIYLGTMDERTYKNAVHAFENGEFELAEKKFMKLEDYKDSEEWLEKTNHMIQVSNDTLPPEIKVTTDSLSFYVGSSFDFDEWAQAGNLVVTDDVSASIAYEAEGTDINMDAEGSYTIVVSATDEAGNTAQKEIAVIVEVKPSKVYEAYADAKEVKIADLKKDAVGSYQYGDISLSSEETEWLNTPWGQNAKYLNQGALYRTYAKKLEGFYVLGKEFYGTWKGNVASIFNFEALDTWEEMEPYVDDAILFISRKPALGEIMSRFQKVEGVTGEFDYVNGRFDIFISDLSKVAQELKINETMLGYLIASLEEYSPEINFKGNTCSIRLSLTHKNSTGMDDFIVYEKFDEKINVMKDLNDMGKGMFYGVWELDDSGASEEDELIYGFYTNKGVGAGSSMSAVILAHGGGEIQKYVKEEDIGYQGAMNAGKNNLIQSLEKCNKYIIYNVNDEGQIYYYFDKDEKMCALLYTNAIWRLSEAGTWEYD